MRHHSLSTIGSCALAAAALVLGGCSSSDNMTGNGNGGRVQLVLSAGSSTAASPGGVSPATLTDDTGRHIQSAGITLSSVLARNLSGELVAVVIDLPVTVDLIALSQGGTVDLPIGALPPGTYDQIVVVIRSLNVTLSDGTHIDVTPPGGGWTVIVPTQPFDVADGTMTTVHLSFRTGGAFEWVDGHLEFHPGFDCHVDDND